MTPNHHKLRNKKVNYFGDLLKLANMFLYGTKHSLVYKLIVYYHYRSF